MNIAGRGYAVLLLGGGDDRVYVNVLTETL